MKKLYLFALAAMLFAACATDDTQDLQPVDAPETLTVGFEGGDDDTRVQLNSAGKTVWTKGDLVSVFYRSDANQKWQFQGKTGDTNGKLKRISQGNTPNIGLDKVVAVYPYNENYLIELQTGNIQAYLPNIQKYAEDSYGIGSSIMISSSRTDKLYLKNVCGWLKLQITGDAVIDYITLKGNNGEQVAGNVFITADDASCTLASDLNDLYGDGSGDLEGTLIDPNTIGSAVLLDCGDGVTLSAEPTVFYIALPPQTFEKGVTVKIVATSGKVITKSTENSLTIERNTIQPMAVFEANAESFGTPTPPPTPANNEIYYNNGSFTKATAPYKTNAFGANIVSNLYDAEKACWVITFDGDVTTIGDYAFYNCTSLTSVTIPDSVTSIGDSAFHGCKSLTNVTIPDSVTSIGRSAFAHCTSLTSITIPDSVISIGNYAFSYCTSLTSITIPDSVTSIGIYAFYGCTSLKAFYGKFASEDNRCLIVDGVLNSFAIGCGATYYTIPDGVTSIGVGAFHNCPSLTSITIPNNVTSIGNYAFSGCTSLKAFYGKFASEDNRCLIVNGVLNSFAIGCGATSYTIPDSVTEIAVDAFYGCNSLTSVTIPDSVTSIGKWAFSDCTLLKSVTIPDSVTSIETCAFYGCTSLTSITIPDSVTSIGGGAFSGCTSLTNVMIGKSVTSIGSSAFYRCTSLKEVYCKPTTPPTGGRDMFSYYDYGYKPIGCKIYVPASADDSIINAYKMAYGWSGYASYIEEYDFSAGQ